MRSFWIVVGLILVWNLLGDAAYLVQATGDLAPMGKAGPLSPKPFPAMPLWAWAAYALAVWIATAGAITLLLRWKVAALLFAVSFVALLAHFAWSFLVFDVIALKGWQQALFPSVIVAINAFQLVYAFRKTADGTLR